MTEDQREAFKTFVGNPDPEPEREDTDEKIGSFLAEPADSEEDETAAMVKQCRAIREAQREVDRCRSREHLAKDAYVTAKAKTKAAEDDRDAIINDRKPPDLLDGVDSVPTHGESGEGTTEPLAGSGDGSYRLVPLDFIPTAERKKLAKADIHTVGDIEAFGVTGKFYDQIDGIGMAGAQKIDDAMLGFWRERGVVPSKPRATLQSADDIADAEARAGR